MVNARLRIAENSATPQINVYPDDIVSLVSHTSSSIDGSEVAIDTCEAVILGKAGNIGLFVPSGADSLTTSDDKLLYVGVDDQALPTIPYGTEVHYFEGSTLMSLWHLESVRRVARDRYELSLISAFGLLENVTHVGGIYQGITLSSLLSEIVGGTFSYTVDSAISSWKVWGWLPYTTARENLHQVLLALGVNIFRNSNGTPRFGVLSTTSPTTIADDDVYIEGQVGYNAPATSISVTEHQWVKRTAETETVFDNLDGSPSADHTTVIFDEPYYDLTPSTGLTVNSSGVNYAIVTGMGTLTGKRYSHIQRVISKTSGASNVKPKEITVTNAYLVNTMNSLNTASRLLGYYSSARTLTGKMVMGTARPGTPVSIKNAFGEQETAIISKMDIISSARLAANFEAASDYTPPASGNNYTTRVQKTGSTTWSKPAGVTQMRIVLIGGGQGGQSGGNGYEGQNGAQGGAGAGGIGGQPGHGGNIFVKDITVPSAATTITISCGVGGAGGEAPTYTQGLYEYGVSGADPVDGELGTNTTITFGSTTYSSASGQPVDDGYSDVISGATFGCLGLASGQSGSHGGKSGTAAGSVTYGGTTYTGGSNGIGGGGAGGGYGGGAAVGSNGGDGMDASQGNNYWYGGTGGRGGDGQSQSKETSVLGAGGRGGHGSGGGGAGGSGASTLLSGSGGGAGIAGTGGEGADGVAIFYY